MPKTKWGGAEKPTVTIFYIKLNTGSFEYALKKCGYTEANRSISYQPKYM